MRRQKWMDVLPKLSRHRAMMKSRCAKASGNVFNCRFLIFGELSPGDKLPSTSQLCQIHGVSAIVVRNAMISLKAEGLVVGVPGVGVYVAER